MSSESGKAFRLRHPWYRLWEKAKERCQSLKHKSYKYYGARGIRFRLSMHDCELIFIRDGGHFMKQPSLDRLNSNEDYHALNCRVIEKAINERLPHDALLAAQWTD